MDDFRQMISSGELTSDGTITLTRIAAEAIRGLNWATNSDAGLDQPAVAYAILGDLAAAAARLGQAFAQIIRYLDRAAAAGQLGHNLGQDPAACVDTASVFLAGAAASAAALADDIDAAQHQMTGMTPEETGSYIRHHLQLAGRDGDLFSDDAINQIHEAARGKPRAVNNLAIAALIATYATGKKIVEKSAARAAISEVISSE